MSHLDPHVSDEETINDSPRLSRQKAQQDFGLIRARGGFDDRLLGSSKHEPPRAKPGWTPIPPYMDPQKRQRLLNAEKRGEVEIERSPSGGLIAYRTLDGRAGP